MSFNLYMPKENPLQQQSSIMTEFTEGSLLLHFRRQTEKTSYSIFDLGGSEVKSGKLEGKDTHQVPVKELVKGIYLLCIIDGDQLYKTRITLP
ncbi:MAG: hypothetical protein FD123_1267 [Bacteroidetes bacterium]|nr:MAG: hypothetical protein FD123_1267 [Bacteroidota bacterium]